MPLRSKGVLLTAIGSMSSPYAIESLKNMGMRVVGTDIHPYEWLAEAGNVDAFYRVPITIDAVGYIKEIMRIAKAERVSYILASTDPEVDCLIAHNDLPQGITLALSPDKVVEICRDKLKWQNELRKICPEVAIDTRVSKESFSSFPLIFKPRFGRSSQGIFTANNEIEAKAVLALIGDKDYIVQPKIEGTVVTVDVLRDPNSKTVISVPRRELIRTANGAGLTVQIFRSERLEYICHTIAGALGIAGTVNFEFIEDSFGNFYSLECNPRFSAGIKFSAMAGYDFVCNHLKVFENLSIDELPAYSDRIITRKFIEVGEAYGHRP